MNKKFILNVEYGTGKVAMITSTPDIIEALKEFLGEYSKSLPDTKMYGLPNIIRAEILPLVYNKNEEENKESKE